MALSFQALPATGAKIGADLITTYNGTADAGGAYAQSMKAGWGAQGAYNDTSLANPFPTQGAANTTFTQAITTADAVVAAPVGDGTLVSGASTAGSIVALQIPNGFVSWTLLIKNFASGTVYTEASGNSTNGTDGDWVEVKGRRTGTAVGVESVMYAMTSNGYWRGNASGFTWIRARQIGGTGFPTITWLLSQGLGATFLNSGLPTSGSVIGLVGQSGTWNIGSISSMPTTPVTGTFFQATQPVSAASLPLPTGAATDGTDITTPTAMPAGGVGMRGWLSAIWTKLNGSLAVTGTFFQATQPVSLATNTPDVTDRAGRLLGQVTNAGTFAVQSAATLSAETTKVIGTVNIAGGSALTAVQGAPALTVNAWPVRLTDQTNTLLLKAASTISALTDVTLPMQDINLGNQVDASATSDAGTFSLIALFKRLLAKITTQLPAALGGATSAASLPVVLSSDTATGSITTQNLVPGGVATAGSAVEIVLNGASSIAPQVTGTYTGALSLQVTVNGTTWITVNGTPFVDVNTGAYLASITSALQSIFQADSGGFTKARITALAAVTGTAVVTIRSSANPSMMALDTALPTGSNLTNDAGTQYRASSTGASSLVAVMSPAATAVATIKAGAGRLVGWQLHNSATALRSVKVFNATAPTLGTTAASFEIDIPASGRSDQNFPGGIAFATAMTHSVTSAKGLTDNTATGLALNDVSGTFFFA